MGLLERVRKMWVALLIDGALVLGFVISTIFPVSIDEIDLMGTWMISMIMLLSWATFLNPSDPTQMALEALPFTLLTAGVFSFAFAFSWRNPLWAILCWLPIVLMYLLRSLRHPLRDRIGKGLGVSSLFLFFLGFGIVCGMYSTSPVPYLLLLAIFLVLTLIWFFKAT